jgi:segregation and condensation protein B
MDTQQLKNIVEAALLAAGSPLTIDQLCALFGDESGPEKQEIRAVLKELQADYEGRGIEIREVASGFRIQVRDQMSQWLSKLWEDRPPRYSRALMETLAIIAYRQPVTRGDIENIRGVSVTSNIIRTMLEREWIKVVGHRDVPGKPAIFGTTRGFLDYFNLKKLDDLPPLAELAQLDPVGLQLELETVEEAAQHEDVVDDANGEGEVDDTDPAGGSAEAELADDESSPIDDPEYEEDDDDLLLSEEEIAAAAERIDAISAELSRDRDAQIDVPPGAVQPLVGLNAPGEEPAAPATVASLDDARAAAADQHSVKTADEALSGQPAEVVPLKTS